MMKYRVFRHADGFLYVRVEEGLINEVKLEDGRWAPAVVYRPVEHLGGKLSYKGRGQFITTEARWAGRFKEISHADICS